MNKILAMATTALLMTTATIVPAWAQPTNSNPLSDVRVRQAIAYAIDMDTIVDTLLEGKAIAAVGLLPNGPYKPNDLNPYKYDPEKAKELLKEAGWDSNRELDLVYYYKDQVTADMMAAFQAYLADVGIKVNYRLLEGDVPAQLSTVPKDPVNGPSAVKWDLAYGALAALALQEYYNRYETGKSAYLPGTPEMDKLIADINSSSDPAVQMPAFHAIEKFENERVDLVPLYYQQLFIYQSDRVDRNGGQYGNEQYSYDWGINNWTVKPDAEGKKTLYTNTGPAQFFELPWLNLGKFIHNKIVFDKLIIADGNLTPKAGQLAESYNVSDDGKTVSFTLRDGITWHDGEPITVNDVSWSIETAAKIPNIHPVVSATFLAIEGAKDFVDGKAQHISGIKTDGKTITLNFAKADPNVLLTFSQFAPLPAKYFEGVDPLQLQQSQFWQKPIGSGPFKIADVKMNDYVTFVPYDKYYGGVPQIDQIVALPSDDNDPNLVKNASAHRLDFGYTKNTGDVAALEGMDFMKVTPADIPYTRMLWINQYPKQ
ncbi:ABC transporter substrate-binding protein [Paradevosia shaoguanensis]|uniref:ABC transporter substrate-binding protein n=1 Tax=Paradevosia shaoguanensis TaxID=1335043 RepID=A0AA41QNE2_9HYPH|nr:ABC transporter substrate-binding protein [Paradevosia shaoguanensis]MCF1742213.1 ABC transporter substrate-binding protein [Paradevosia shaoguanensis]MCI0126696.1 ABC transporter substrate-binding protein [Paradevosia shaoguanensis]